MPARVTSRYQGNTRVGSPQTGLRSYGVPPGGPFDTLSADIVRILTGDSLACWIELVAPLTMEFDHDSVVAWGDHAAICVAGTHHQGPGRVRVPQGIEVTILPASGLARRYVSWPGLRGNASSVPVVEGDVLDSRPSNLMPIRLDTEPLSPPRQIRFLPVGSAGLVPHAVSASPVMDRVGLRFSPGPEDLPTLASSEPSVLGAIQATPSGELLVHGPDGPTITGYPVLGCVIRADLDLLGRVCPGQTIEFPETAHPAAAEAARESARHRSALINQVKMAVMIADGSA